MITLNTHGPIEAGKGEDLGVAAKFAELRKISTLVEERFGASSNQRLQMWRITNSFESEADYAQLPVKVDRLRKLFGARDLETLWRHISSSPMPDELQRMGTFFKPTGYEICSIDEEGVLVYNGAHITYDEPLKVGDACLHPMTALKPRFIAEEANGCELVYILEEGKALVIRGVATFPDNDLLVPGLREQRERLHAHFQGLAGDKTFHKEFAERFVKLLSPVDVLYGKEEILEERLLRFWELNRKCQQGVQEVKRAVRGADTVREKLARLSVCALDSDPDHQGWALPAIQWDPRRGDLERAIPHGLPLWAQKEIERVTPGSVAAAYQAQAQQERQGQRDYASEINEDPHLTPEQRAVA